MLPLDSNQTDNGTRFKHRSRGLKNRKIQVEDYKIAGYKIFNTFFSYSASSSAFFYCYEKIWSLFAREVNFPICHLTTPDTAHRVMSCFSFSGCSSFFVTSSKVINPQEHVETLKMKSSQADK